VVIEAVTEQPVSAVSWPAIWAGAAVATAMTLILLLLGAGIGLASISPWPNMGATAAAFGVGAAIWLVIVQWASSAAGGYVAGRLRTRWTVHSDEVFFRDTAHGLVTWAIATLIVAALVVMSAFSIARTGTEAAATVAAGAAEGMVEAGDGTADPPFAYFVDTLFRAPAMRADADVRGETLRILVRGLAAETFPPGDRAYLVELVAAQTGLPPAEAETRVNTVIAEAQAAERELRAAADDVREAAAMLAFYTFISMLIGAFIAAVAAAIGGRQRDAVSI
jgi:hypothetical protein